MQCIKKCCDVGPGGVILKDELVVVFLEKAMNVGHGWSTDGSILIPTKQTEHLSLDEHDVVEVSVSHTLQTAVIVFKQLTLGWTDGCEVDY